MNKQQTIKFLRHAEHAVLMTHPGDSDADWKAWREAQDIIREAIRCQNGK
jgi:hypothetical protein